MYAAEFHKDLVGGGALHRGGSTGSIAAGQISLQGEIAPGADHKLDLSPDLVETLAQFNANKAQMTRVGDVRTFRNCVVTLARHIDPTDFTTAVVWCEAFGQ